MRRRWRHRRSPLALGGAPLERFDLLPWRPSHWVAHEVGRQVHQTSPAGLPPTVARQALPEPGHQERLDGKAASVAP